MPRKIVSPKWTYALFMGCALHHGTSASAQVVQLPSTRSLSYSGSVWVPDGGTTSLGGVNRLRTSSSSSGWGPYASGAISSSAGAAGLSVSAQVIDLAALDEAMLGRARPAQPAAAPTQGLSSTSSTGAAAMKSATEAATPTTQSIPLGENLSSRVGADPGRWLRTLAGAPAAEPGNPQLLESEIRYFLQQAAAAEDAGRLNAARVYYKMARERMPVELIERYETILAERAAAEEARRQAELEAIRRRF